ncbi:TPA: type II toxin-antitoxin system HicA family toxin [Candidatus Woesearchaeota archaeon]|nr:type II toxin-antitoxin system HicA family toxin [Candidatus Woesearchaeota archaeon]HII68518.1 type II toxin-antitoxin system HicA family toxin [Candidatus Woesearchaeota archaeon]
MKLPLLSSAELCRFLEKEGFSLVRQRGSHRFYRHPDGRTTVVPMHANKDIKRTLLHGILKEIKMSREDFFEKYK